jgi:hypothetical protein
VSFGVVDAHNAQSLPELASRADAALFEAKHRGRNQVVVHDAAGKAVGLSELPPEPTAPSPGGVDPGTEHALHLMV